MYLLPQLKGHLYSGGERDTISRSRIQRSFLSSKTVWLQEALLRSSVHSSQWRQLSQHNGKLSHFNDLQWTTPKNTITYHNALCLSPQILHKHCFQFLLGPNAYAKFWSDKQRALWYVMAFLEWSIDLLHLWEYNTKYRRDTYMILIHYVAAWNNNCSRFQGWIKNLHILFVGELLTNPSQPPFRDICAVVPMMSPE